jgi:multidrug efflux pump subunit AcrA (membrane-fusion protein)
MKLRLCLAASALALSAFLAAPAVAQDNSMPSSTSGHTDVNGMPTNHSTQAEHAATAGLNNQAADANTKADAQSDAQADQNNAQYQAQQQQYQDQLRQNQAAQSQYQDRTVAYETLRAHYVTERMAYHRGVWPSRYEHWTLEENSADLTGQRVEIVNGDRVGTVTEVARSPNGRVEALRVKLDSDKVVWIDQADVRYDHAGGIVMTNLDRADLRRMADERM